MRESHRRTDDQKQDVSEDRALVTVNESTRQSYQNQKKIQSPKLGPNKKKTKRNVRDASRQQPSKRGKNNGQVPQARVLADNVLQPSTKLKADIVQTASDIKRQLLNFARKCKLTFASTISLSATNCQLSMRHEASDLPSFICHAANDDQPSIRKYAMNLNFVFPESLLHAVNHEF